MPNSTPETVSSAEVAGPNPPIQFSWPIGSFVFVRPEVGKPVTVRGRLIAVAGWYSSCAERLDKQYRVRFVTPVGEVRSAWFGERELDSDIT